MSSVAERLADVQARVDTKLLQLNRSVDEVTMVVITKNHPVDLALELYNLGCRNFGENRDQEAGPKAAQLLQLINADDAPKWHFVGQLQSNKAKRVCEYADTVHSVDRESLLDALIKATEFRTRALDIFLQVNLTDDPNRGGITPDRLEEFAESALQANGLRLMGVMAVASLEGKERSDFELVQSLSLKVQELDAGARYISAGMSNDFELALEYGATHLRIGTAITGNRTV